MRQILCYGDSNTYGYVPGTGKRYPWGVRWTSILNEMLGMQEYRVIEEGLCGRTTVYEDVTRRNRDGSKVLPVVLESQGVCDLVVIMLGTNDCKTAYKASAEEIGEGMRKLIRQVCTYSESSKILIRGRSLGEGIRYGVWRGILKGQLAARRSLSKCGKSGGNIFPERG